MMYLHVFTRIRDVQVSFLMGFFDVYVVYIYIYKCISNMFLVLTMGFEFVAFAGFHDIQVKAMGKSSANHLSSCSGLKKDAEQHA